MQSEIDGTWIVESATSTGFRERELADKGNRFTIAAGTLKLDDEIAEGMYPALCSVDASAKHIDITPVMAGTPSPEFADYGIYELENDRLTICIAANHVAVTPAGVEIVKSVRPTDFKASEISQLIVLKRVRPN